MMPVQRVQSIYDSAGTPLGLHPRKRSGVCFLVRQVDRFCLPPARLFEERLDVAVVQPRNRAMILKIDDMRGSTALGEHRRIVAGRNDTTVVDRNCGADSGGLPGLAVQSR